MSSVQHKSVMLEGGGSGGGAFATGNSSDQLMQAGCESLGKACHSVFFMMLLVLF